LESLLWIFSSSDQEFPHFQPAIGSSTADQLAHILSYSLQANQIVYRMASEKAMVYLRKILITTDLSEFSLAAIEYATSLGLIYSSKLYLLHVLDYTPPKFHGRDRDSQLRAHQHAVEGEARRELADFILSKIGLDAKLIPMIRTGSPAHVIKRFAEEEGVDLIVMATHGRAGLRHILMGSVAEKVVRTSSIPVLTVKPQPLRESILNDEDIENELHLK